MIGRYCSLLALVCALAAGEDLVRNGGFADGLAAWDGAAVDATAEAVVEQYAGKPCLRLTRKAAGGTPQVQQYNLHLKPLTLYRFSVSGSGDGTAAIRVGPSASTDGEFAQHFKAAAVSSSPLPPSSEERTESLLFDSGRIADGAWLSLRLDGDQPASYRFTRVAFEAVGSSAPDAQDIVVAHLGDSITITSYLPFSQRVDALLAEPLQAAAKPRRVRQVNLGVDGETVADLLAGRYDHAIKAMYPKLDVVVVRFGANDHRSRDPQAFSADLATLCDRLAADYPGVRIVIGTGPYVRGQDDINLRQYGPWWQAAREFAAQRGYAVADVYAAFAEAASSDLCRAPDDMHPSAAGVAVAAGALARTLAPLLATPR